MAEQDFGRGNHADWRFDRDRDYFRMLDSDTRPRPGFLEQFEAEDIQVVEVAHTCEDVIGACADLDMLRVDVEDFVGESNNGLDGGDYQAQSERLQMQRGQFTKLLKAMLPHIEGGCAGCMVPVRQSLVDGSAFIHFVAHPETDLLLRRIFAVLDKDSEQETGDERYADKDPLEFYQGQADPAADAAWEELKPLIRWEGESPHRPSASNVDEKSDEDGTTVT